MPDALGGLLPTVSPSRCSGSPSPAAGPVSPTPAFARPCALTPRPRRAPAARCTAAPS